MDCDTVEGGGAGQSGEGAHNGSEALSVPASVMGSPSPGRPCRIPCQAATLCPRERSLGCCGPHGGSEDVAAGGQQPPGAWLAQGRSVQTCTLSL